MRKHLNKFTASALSILILGVVGFARIPEPAGILANPTTVHSQDLLGQSTRNERRLCFAHPLFLDFQRNVCLSILLAIDVFHRQLQAILAL